MRVGVGYSDNPDSSVAGRQASQQALGGAEGTDICDLVLLFSTARHNQQILRREVAAVTGNTNHIFGGGAVGIITNEIYGYAGDQVGVACIWFDGGDYRVASADGLSQGEFDVGIKLADRLKQSGIMPDSPVMMFYDSINKNPDNARLVMATLLLEGIERGLGFIPDMVGAGIQGDHILTPSKQFLGNAINDDSAFVLSFPDGICMDHVILHGCRPASPYYTVTKADGPVILEINGQPAISFIDDLLGSSITPEQYPFFLIFGINHGNIDEEFQEKNYASRLCQGIDMEAGGIVMFEPDMITGTRFQIMFRTMEPDYIRPHVEELLNKLDDKKPVFGFYINCAGRCAGFGGTDIEDACVIQDIVAGRFPLLGIYTGVEIASIGGKPRGLDWTGVFCVFSESKGVCNGTKVSDGAKFWDNKNNHSGGSRDLSCGQLRELTLQNLAKVLELDARNIAIRNELERKRRSFGLLSELSVFLKNAKGLGEIFQTVARRINSILNMQKTVLMLPDPKGNFIPATLQGYTEKEKVRLKSMSFCLEEDLSDLTKAVLVTASDQENYLATLRKALKMPYFISTPIFVEKELSGIVIAGRTAEIPPFLPSLNINDKETLQSISALLSSYMVQEKLSEATKRASTDTLTGLLNRGAHARYVAGILNKGFAKEEMSAFILIDLDYLKDINDSYGHIVGDRVLKSLSRVLQNNFRSSDIISRFGGDEFVVFCPSVRKIDSIEKRVKRLVQDWHRTPLKDAQGKVFYSSVSAGISIAPDDGTTYKELLYKADIALYKIKNGKRNGYCIYCEGVC